MSSLLKSYLPGVKRLKEEMKRKGSDCKELDLLQMRLSENIDKCAYGDTKENRAERNEILDSLNEIVRSFHNISFAEYCQLKSGQTLAVVHLVVEEIPAPIENTLTKPYSAMPVEVSSTSGTQQANASLLSAREYIVTLQQNVQRAKEAFTNSANIDQDLCEEVLASFYVFDCSRFPEYNISLHKAKTRLDYLNEQVNKLHDLCEACGDVDRFSRVNRRKIRLIIGVVDSLYYDVESVKVLIEKFDVDK